MDLYNSKIIDENNDIVFFDEFANGLRVTYLSNEKSGWFADLAKYNIEAKSISLN